MTKKISGLGDWMLSRLIPRSDAEAVSADCYGRYHRDYGCDSWCGGYYLVCWSRECPTSYDWYCRPEY